MIFRVSAARFSKLYNDLIYPNGVKFVNWYVDANSFLHCYITWDSETYYYTTHASDIPESVRGTLRVGGEVLGVVDESPTVNITTRQKAEDFLTKGGRR